MNGSRERAAAVLGPRLMTAEEAVSIVESGHRVFIGSGCGTPRRLVHALESLDKPLSHVQLVSFFTVDSVPIRDGKPVTRFNRCVFSVSPDVQPLLREGKAEYVPLSLAEALPMIIKGKFGIDVAFVQVSPPDEHGFCSLGVSVDITRRAVNHARIIVAEINPNMPRTLGNTAFPASRIDRAVWVDEPVLEFRYAPADDVAERIARYVARIIDDGSTLQIGFGQIPGEMLKHLTGRRDLAIHSDLITDGVVDLVEAGIITNLRKAVRMGTILGSWCMGTERLYRKVDDNLLFNIYPLDFVCHPVAITMNEKFVSVTEAHAIDLTGQICADQYDGQFHFGISTQPEFMKGAAASPGGRPIVCLRSTSPDGRKSRIKIGLEPGEGVTVPRSEVHYVVTEYGSAYLHGASIHQRAVKLIEIAHPDFRAQLLEEAKKIGYVHSAVEIRSCREYPVGEEIEVTAKSGAKILIRPSRASDFVGMQNLFYRLTDQDRYTRFFTRLASLSVSASEHLCSVDYEHEMAFVALEAGDEKESIIGASCYYMDPATCHAEVAFMIHPDWQCAGVGKALLQRMLEYARCRGIKGFVADILPENHKMIGLFKNAVGNVSVRRDEGTLEMTVHF